MRDIMDMAVAEGLTLLRTFAFATNPLYPMQTSPGVYNEAIFRGLDYVLDQARQRGIKACGVQAVYSSRQLSYSKLKQI